MEELNKLICLQVQELREFHAAVRELTEALLLRLLLGGVRHFPFSSSLRPSIDLNQSIKP